MTDHWDSLGRDFIKVFRQRGTIAPYAPSSILLLRAYLFPVNTTDPSDAISLVAVNSSADNGRQGVV